MTNGSSGFGGGVGGGLKLESGRLAGNFLRQENDWWLAYLVLQLITVIIGPPEGGFLPIDAAEPGSVCGIAKTPQITAYPPHFGSGASLLVSCEDFNPGY